MAAYNPPGWLQNAGATHTAVQMRNYTGMFSAGNDGATSMRPYGGIHPSLGNSLNVTQSGSPAMSVVVKSGAAWIPGTENSVQGMYGVVNDADVTLTIAAAHATLGRIDIVCFKVEDSQYSGANNTSSLVVVTGTPSGSPAQPTPPNNSITLCLITVGAAVTTITNANINMVRKYLTGIGGLQRIFDSTERNALTGLYSGYPVWRVDLNAINVYDGSGWRFFARPTTATVATQQNTTATSYGDLATVGPAVTVETGTAALVTLTTLLLNSAGNVAFMAFAISGATTVAATDVQSLQYPGTIQAKFSVTYLVTGLTAGSNTFTAKYKVAAGTGTFVERVITVTPV